MRKQAEKFGTKFIDTAVGSVDFLSRPFKINVGDIVHTAEAVIIATGSSAMWLGLESESRLKGK
jgi:thioredoxin reductase (NADPH)